MSHLRRWWPLLGFVAALFATEWLRTPGPAWVAAVWVAAIGLVAAAWPLRTPSARLAGAAAIVLALGIATSQFTLTSIERDWARVRERRVAAASEKLAGRLHDSFRRAEQAAVAAATLCSAPQREAFRRLDDLVPGGGAELGVAVLERTGVPWAWTGRHRLLPRAEGDSIASRATGYYLVLETRRHCAEGRVAVASLLIWAHPVVPEPGRSLVEGFRQETGVGLRIFPPGAAPNGRDIFDYEEPTTAGPRLLFSVQPEPPEQGQAKEDAQDAACTLVTLLVLALLTALLAAVETVPERFAAPLLLVWLFARAPAGSALGLGSIFSPATFFRPLLGAFSASAGVLALTGGLLTLVGAWLWRSRLPRRWYGLVAAAALLLVAPYVVRELARGITPPSNGVPTGLWLTWHLTILLTGAAFVVSAAALARGRGGEAAPGWRLWVGAGIAIAATLIGLVLWSPRGGWPAWYTFLWTPALVLVALPAPRWSTILGIALVAGSAAALVTWGAELDGRLDVARRDVGRLGTEVDPLAVPLLERVVTELDSTPPPGTPSELYALWRAVNRGSDPYPARLAVWSRDGSPRFELALDSLDLPASLLSTMVQNLDSTTGTSITRVLRVPGNHYILLARLGADRVLSVTVGPRTALIHPDRVDRLLTLPGDGLPLYDLALSFPTPGALPDSTPLRWRRDGWSVLGERRLALPGGVRQVHAEVELRGPGPLIVRGALVLVLDVLVLALLWALADALAGRPPDPRRWRRALRSFQARLALTLGLFFILPALGFAAWNLGRLRDEARRGRDLLITQTLRDAVATAGGLVRGPGEMLPDGLRELGRGIDADVALYSGGTLDASSSPVLSDLGLIPPLLDPDAFIRLAIGDELEATLDGPGQVPPLRVGYRVVEPGPPGGIGILATPQLADDSALARDQLDLGFVLLLATVLGAIAALGGAQLAARTLSRPVAELREAALALGEGRLPTPLTGAPPVEFEPVFGAFERMTADIRASQAALEEARRRTAAVLATVATGVVAIDPDGRVLLANRRAMELLGVSLPEGDRFEARLAAAWAPLVEAVRRFLARGDPAGTTAEFDIGDRRFGLQLARLGADLGGAVLALNDLTGVARAERVLAWGEMARQVAHEIKNPLTPMRLGIQHLQRAYRDPRGDFDQALADTAERILGEIDRLDTIARAFSRFAAPAGEVVPLESVDLVAVAQDVVQLYRLAGEGAQVSLVVDGTARAEARKDEVKEVLVNLLENARGAGATVVTVRVHAGTLEVEDDGRGIEAEQLPRIFEPRFSTTTSGSGLGLAIVKRLVEGWGGRVEVRSQVGKGTLVKVALGSRSSPSGSLG